MSRGASELSTWRWLADAYEQAQRMRLAMEGRQRAARQGSDQSPNLADLAGDIIDRMQQIEAMLTKEMKEALEAHPSWPWLQEVTGIGPVLAAKIVSMVDFERATTISKLWRFAGLAVIDGRAERRERGKVNRFNARLKTTMYLVGTSFLRSQSPYTALYYQARQAYWEAKQIRPLSELCPAELAEFQRKQKESAFADPEEERKAWYELIALGQRRYLERNGGAAQDALPWTDQHVHLASLRRMVKIFLAHLWLYTRKRMGLPVGPPYCVEKMGHHGHDEYEFVRRSDVERNEQRQIRRMREGARKLKMAS